MMVDSTADHHCMVSRIPKCSSTQAPTGRFGPSASSSRYPTTVGGRTSGRVRTTSRSPFTSRGAFAV